MYVMTSSTKLYQNNWKPCKFCSDVSFRTTQEFKYHLRNRHCKKEGGSYVCRYGLNNVCSSLPLEGVSEVDYDHHVAKHHVPTDDTNVHVGNEIIENLSNKYQHILYNPATQQPNVVNDRYKWTVYDSSQNLPAVLNDPRRTSREGDLFTKTWGDNFIEKVMLPFCPYLSEIAPIHFEAYLKCVKKRMQRSSRKSLSRRRSDSKHEIIQHPHLVASGGSVSEIENIPKVFMQADFNLENPDMFNMILPWSQLYSHSSSGKATIPKSSVRLLQEKMSHYLDLVEVQIAKQISERSEAFFNAMTSHDALMDELTYVIESVCALRKRIHEIGDVNATSPIKVLKLKQQQSNYFTVLKKLKMMTTVQQTQPTIQLLLSTSEFVGALDLIYTTHDILVQELAGIQSFRHFSSQLYEMEKVIGKMMQNDFVRYVTADLNRPLTEYEVMEEDRLAAILHGMLRQGQFSFVQVFKDECYTAINAAVKQTVAEVMSEADDFETENSTGNLVEQLQALSVLKWLGLLQLTLDNLSLLLKRIQAMCHVMIETTDRAAGYNPAMTQQSEEEGLSEHNSQQQLQGEMDVVLLEKDYVFVKSSLKDLICAVCDHAHDRCAKMLTAKSKDGSLDKLNTSEFVQLAKAIKGFQQHSKSICGRTSMPLQHALQNEATRFAARFHEERKAKLCLLLDNELWKPAEVPVEFQELMNHIMSSENVTMLEPTVRIIEKDRTPQPNITVGNETFIVVGTVLLLLKMAVEYCQCAEDVPILATDIATRLVELFNAFNSRTCQLVTGAKALHVVGLKTITTRHLAVTSRCVKFVMQLLPQVRKHFVSRVPQNKQALIIKHFDQLPKNYDAHIAEINKKMEMIIGEMFEKQLSQWEVKAPVPSPCFSSISRHLSKFHEAICDLFPSDELRNIFCRINNIFKLKLKFHLLRLQVSIDGGPQHGLVTQELTFYVQNLRKLNSVYDFSVNDLWQTR